MTYYDYQINILVASDKKLSKSKIRKEINRQIKKIDGFSPEVEIEETVIYND